MTLLPIPEDVTVNSDFFNYDQSLFITIYRLTLIVITFFPQGPPEEGPEEAVPVGAGQGPRVDHHEGGPRQLQFRRRRRLQ